MKRGKLLALTSLVLAFYALHQDFWNWRRAEPLVLGFLPVGLAYHVGYSIWAAVTMAVLVRLAWPRHLEQTDSSPSPRPAPTSETRQ